MKRAFLLLVLSLARAVAADQNALPADGILIQRPAKYAAWQVTYEYSDTANKGLEKAASPKSTRGVMGRPIKVVVTKTEPNRSIVTIDEDGQKEVRFCVGRNQFVYPPGASTAIMTDGATPGDPFFVPIKADFQEFGWISKNKFRGITQYAGRDCLVFVDEMSPSELETKQQDVDRELKYAMDFIANTTLDETGAPRTKPERPAPPEKRLQTTALVDLATRAPVMLRLPDQTRFYTSLPAPQGMVALPEEVSKTVVAIENYRKRLAQPPTSP